eukprot:gene45835-63430_t
MGQQQVTTYFAVHAGAADEPRERGDGTGRAWGDGSGRAEWHALRGMPYFDLPAAAVAAPSYDPRKAPRFA